MPDSTLSAAIKEAYASARTVDTVYHTLEMHHDSFEAPIRVVRGSEDLNATLESTAPVEPNTEVTFVRYWFDFAKPERTAGGNPQCTITIDNINRSIYQALHDAAISGTPITVYYREFLASDTSVPQQNPPFRFTAVSATVDATKATLVVAFRDILNRKLGRKTRYTAERFPGLVIQ